MWACPDVGSSISSQNPAQFSEFPHFALERRERPLHSMPVVVVIEPPQRPILLEPDFPTFGTGGQNRVTARMIRAPEIPSKHQREDHASDRAALAVNSV